ncbi:MAG: hypothetical protein RIC55_11795 [Pirellulaceae bacterium]
MSRFVVLVFLFLTATGIASGSLAWASSAQADDEQALAVARDVVMRERGRLARQVQETKDFMARARLTADKARELQHAIGRWEATMAAYDVTLSEGPKRALVLAAKAVVHGQLEQLYAARVKNPKQNDEQSPKREQALLDELKLLEDWQGKSSKTP